VVYFAKAPLPGRVKTRLSPPLTPGEAAGLYAAWLRALRPVPGCRTLVYGWPAAELDALRAVVPAELELRAQRGADLWARMAACMAELFAQGHSPVVIRNTDAPDLPPERVREAIARCKRGTAVLGPDAGGGYYLVALAEPCAELFGGSEGAPTVHAQTVARARALGLAVEELAVEADVDTYADLLELWRRRGG
jgi:hypothetical protein